MTLAVGELLARRARLDGDRPAVVTPGRTWRYAEFDRHVDGVAAALAAAGIGAGDRVAVALRNGDAYLALYYALARVGAVLVGVNWRLAEPEVAHILADAAPQLLVCDPEFTQARSAADAARIACVDRIEPKPDGPPTRAIDPCRVLAICYTSGTTGRPKGAMLTHAQLIAAGETIQATVDYRLHDVSLIATPLFHVGGLSFATLFTARGATAFVPPAWVPAEVAAAIATHRVNHFFAVPAMLDALLPALSDVSSLRWIMTGAAPLPARMIDAYHARGIPLLQSYGATETAGPAACMDVAHVLTKPGSIGKPFFESEVRVDAVPGTLGELFVRGRHVFAGYWGNPQATREVLADGWLATGDVGYVDADGYLFLVDRKKEVIISGGENVYPAEVERVLAEHPAIVEAAVIGVPDARWGEAVCAVVVLRAGAALDLQSLRAYCRERLASFKLPGRLVVNAGPLARNATGKIVKQRLRETIGAI